MNQPVEWSNTVKVNREIIEIQQLIDDIADIKNKQEQVKASISDELNKNDETLTETNITNYMADALT